MINSVTYSPEVDYLYQKTNTKRQTTHITKNQISTGDKFISKDSKKNVQNAIKDGSLVYTEPTKFLGLTLRDGFYTYTPQNNETIGDIKQKFGIKDGVIGDMNGIYDDDVCPAQIGKKSINFSLEE